MGDLSPGQPIMGVVSVEIEPVYRTSSFCSGGDCLAVAFRKSSFSVGTGACVEVGITTTDVLVRDTKDRTRPALTFPAAEWTAFVAGIRNGEL